MKKKKKKYNIFGINFAPKKTKIRTELKIQIEVANE